MSEPRAARPAAEVAPADSEVPRPESEGGRPGPERMLTVDELAARTGMTVRTVRFYAAEGLLPPPLRQGRIAYYGPAHRMRLDFIRELQEFGYTLAGIERYLARIPPEATAGELAVHRALLAPWEPQRACELDLDGLQQRAGRTLDDMDLEFLAAIGIIARHGDHFRVTPSMLAVGVELLGMPVPLEVLREAAVVIQSHATAAAEGLTEVFRAGIWEPFHRGEVSGADADQLATVVARLRPIAVQGLVAAFEKAADRAVRGVPRA
ncbi:MerR family transcriptional regulator [Jatrophihabitans telluris]|uniref:MerR family transcriptional regulator n=1 Tax=Jatrophihabitans telluris TaxID=2038343 RepID=A0ABY4QZT5_9ACTN|nr:MerR family transcriptional regulator [Jatrophihabitans telluris]UQX88843.1 MerR family transcriptional regulator [Jatrophihabitans telluris]